MGYGILGPGQVLNVKVCPLPVIKVCSYFLANIHVVNIVGAEEEFEVVNDVT